MKQGPNSIFKSLLTIAALIITLYWVAAYLSDNGGFKSKNQSSGSAPGDATDLGARAEPTATPLPPHFPETDANDLQNIKSDNIPIAEAYQTCWPGRQDIEAPSDDILTIQDVEMLFGKVRKRELIEQTDKGAKWGLLFDESIFQPHPVGSAIETNETAETPVKALRSLHLRAAGRMLHCENARSCECI